MIPLKYAMQTKASFVIDVDVESSCFSSTRIACPQLMARLWPLVMVWISADTGAPSSPNSISQYRPVEWRCVPWDRLRFMPFVVLGVMM